MSFFFTTTTAASGKRYTKTVVTEPEPEPTEYVAAGYVEEGYIQ